MNLGDGRTAPKTQRLSPAWNGYGVGQCILKTGCPETPSPYVLEDFVPAVLGSAGRRERRESTDPQALKTLGGRKVLA